MIGGGRNMDTSVNLTGGSGPVKTAGAVGGSAARQQHAEMIGMLLDHHTNGGKDSAGDHD